MTAAFAFDNSYARDLDGLYVPWQPEAAPEPKLLALNLGLAAELGLDVDQLREHGAAWFSGTEVPTGASPLAQAYAGHQFGGFNPQLGDGRALLLGELVDTHGDRRDLQLKGSGRTPFSRGGDGKAALGPVLREYLIGEAMHALGVPTTRALAATTTGQPVRRETYLPGAVLARVAASHIRVGTFEFFAVRDDRDNLERLLHYTLARHYPDAEGDSPALALLLAVRDAQASLVARWMHLGFIHGVMNTDNVTVSGETIDYGPCAFMDGHDPDTVFSSIDRGGRYAYGNQPGIAQWNLARFASALLPLIHDDRDAAVELAQQVIDSFPGVYEAYWAAGLRTKLGLADDAPIALGEELIEAMTAAKADHTKTFRALADARDGDDLPFLANFADPAGMRDWLARWKAEAVADGATLRGVNPVYIPRNHLVEEALEAAVSADDLGPFQALLDVLEHPFEAREGLERYAEPASDAFTAGYKTFCGT